MLNAWFLLRHFFSFVVVFYGRSHFKLEFVSLYLISFRSRHYINWIFSSFCIHLCFLPPILTHKLSRDLLPPACQHSCEEEICGRNCIFFAGERQSPVWDEWRRALSSICKSMLRFNLLNLPPQCGSTVSIQNHPLKRCSFLPRRKWAGESSPWPRLVGPTTHVASSVGDKTPQGNCFLKSLPHHRYNRWAAQFCTSSPNCASWCLHVFYFTVEKTHKSALCLVSRRQPCRWNGDVYIPSSWGHHGVAVNTMMPCLNKIEYEICSKNHRRRSL